MAAKPRRQKYCLFRSDLSHTSVGLFFLNAFMVDDFFSLKKSISYLNYFDLSNHGRIGLQQFGCPCSFWIGHIFHLYIAYNSFIGSCFLAAECIIPD